MGYHTGDIADFAKTVVTALAREFKEPEKKEEKPAEKSKTPSKAASPVTRTEESTAKAEKQDASLIDRLKGAAGDARNAAKKNAYTKMMVIVLIAYLISKHAK